MDRKYFISVVILMVAVVGILVITTQERSKQMPPSTIPATKCGDGICEVDEDCNTCPEDCGCEAGEYCSDNGICRGDVCGDGQCTEGERESCCQDCSCEGDEICNKYTGSCVKSVEADKSDVEEVIDGYLKENGISARIVHIEDSYFKDKAIKEVLLDCSQPDSEVPCGITLILDENLNIVEEYRTI